MKAFAPLMISVLATSILTACSGQQLSPLAIQRMQAPQLRSAQTYQAQQSRSSQSILPVKNTLPAADGTRDVTSLSYLALDNNLQDSALKFIYGVKDSASSKGYFPFFYDLEGPNNTFVGLVQGVADNQQFASPFDLLNTRRGTQEANSADPAVLAQTVNWAFSKYPSRRKVMTISTHGAGYLGIVTDDHSADGAGFSAQSYAQGLRQGLKGRQLDILNMSACLMSNIEALYELQGTAKVVLASEDSMLSSPDTEFDYIQEFNRVAAITGVSEGAIAKHMVTYGSAKHPNSGFYTLSAIDMQQIPALKSQVNVFAQSLMRAMPRYAQEIHLSYSSVPGFALSDGMGQRDLYNFATQIMHRVPDPNLKSAAQNVRAQVRRTLIHHRDKEGAASNGISIFMPDTTKPENAWQMNYAQGPYRSSRMARDTAWDEFLAMYIGSLQG